MKEIRNVFWRESREGRDRLEYCGVAGNYYYYYYCSKALYWALDAFSVS
jgi:hypothetical protein